MALGPALAGVDDTRGTPGQRLFCSGFSGLVLSDARFRADPGGSLMQEPSLVSDFQSIDALASASS